MKEIRSYTPQEVIENDTLRAKESALLDRRDIFAWIDDIRRENPEWWHVCYEALLEEHGEAGLDAFNDYLTQGGRL